MQVFHLVTAELPSAVPLLPVSPWKATSFLCTPGRECGSCSWVMVQKRLELKVQCGATCNSISESWRKYGCWKSDLRWGGGMGITPRVGAAVLLALESAGLLAGWGWVELQLSWVESAIPLKSSSFTWLRNPVVRGNFPWSATATKDQECGCSEEVWTRPTCPVGCGQVSSCVSCSKKKNKKTPKNAFLCVAASVMKHCTWAWPHDAGCSSFNKPQSG